MNARSGIVIGLMTIFVSMVIYGATIAESDNIPSGVSISGLVAVTEPDNYGNPAYGTVTYTDSYTFTHTYTVCDEFDCWEETEEHPATFKYKIGYQIYLYHDGSSGKYKYVIPVLWIQKDYSDESSSWTCFSGHRVLDYYIYSYETASSFFLANDPSASSNWFLPNRGIFKDEGTAQLGISAGVGYKLVSFEITMTLGNSNVPYGVDIPYYRTGEGSPDVDWRISTLTENDLSKIGIIWKPSGAWTCCDGHRDAYLRNHDTNVYSVAYQLVRVPSMEYYSPGWIYGRITRIGQTMYSWTGWASGTHWGWHMSYPYKGFSYYLDTYSLG